MSYRKWEEFAEFAQSSIRSFNNSFGASVETYYKALSAHSFMIIGEKRNTLLDPESSYSEKEFYLKSMLSKIGFLYSNVFEELSIGLRFIPDNFIVTEENDATISSARALNRSILVLKKEFQTEHDEFLNFKKILPLATKRRKRRPSRESFEIKKGKDVNLRAVHEYLINEEHPFILGNTSYDFFELVFSGKPVLYKVIWINANALHYFINCIHGVGTERANEGHWVRASKCFKVLDEGNNPKDFTPDQIKDAGDPVASITSLLDKAIDHFR